jgi:hypothetical protein
MQGQRVDYGLLGETFERYMDKVDLNYPPVPPGAPTASKIPVHRRLHLLSPNHCLSVRLRTGLLGHLAPHPLHLDSVPLLHRRQRMALGLPSRQGGAGPVQRSPGLVEVHIRAVRRPIQSEVRVDTPEAGSRVDTHQEAAAAHSPADSRRGVENPAEEGAPGEAVGKDQRLERAAKDRREGVKAQRAKLWPPGSGSSSTPEASHSVEVVYPCLKWSEKEHTRVPWLVRPEAPKNEHRHP